jgi:hypothetical protein
MGRKTEEAKQKFPGHAQAAESVDLSRQKKGPTLGEAFEELRRICEEENYTLEIPRQKRPNPFPNALDELPG